METEQLVYLRDFQHHARSVLTRHELDLFYRILKDYHQHKHVGKFVVAMTTLLTSPVKRDLVLKIRLLVPQGHLEEFDRCVSRYGLAHVKSHDPRGAATLTVNHGSDERRGRHAQPSAGLGNIHSVTVVKDTPDDSLGFSVRGGAEHNLVGSGNIHSVTVVKDTPDDSLGFSVRGGADHNLGIFVSEVDHDSPAELSGLKVGDQILEVNTINLSAMSCETAAKVMNGASRLKLKIERTGKVPGLRYSREYISWCDTDVKKLVRGDLESRNRFDTDVKKLVRGDLESRSRSPVHNEPWSNSAERKVNLTTHRKGAPLGFNIRGGGEFNLGIYVSRVDEGGLADRTGLRVGDHITSVNGTSFANITHKQASKILRSQRHLVLTVKATGRYPAYKELCTKYSWVNGSHNGTSKFHGAHMYTYDINNSGGINDVSFNDSRMEASTQTDDEDDIGTHKSMTSSKHNYTHDEHNNKTRRPMTSSRLGYTDGDHGNHTHQPMTSSTHEYMDNKQNNTHKFMISSRHAYLPSMHTNNRENESDNINAQENITSNYAYDDYEDGITHQIMTSPKRMQPGNQFILRTSSESNILRATDADVKGSSHISSEDLELEKIWSSVDDLLRDSKIQGHKPAQRSRSLKQKLLGITTKTDSAKKSDKSGSSRKERHNSVVKRGVFEKSFGSQMMYQMCVEAASLVDLEERCRGCLGGDEVTAMMRHIHTYHTTGDLTRLLNVLTLLLDKPVKLQLLTNIREIIHPSHLTQYDNTVHLLRLAKDPSCQPDDLLSDGEGLPFESDDETNAVLANFEQIYAEIDVDRPISSSSPKNVDQSQDRVPMSTAFTKPQLEEMYAIPWKRRPAKAMSDSSSVSSVDSNPVAFDDLEAPAQWIQTTSQSKEEMRVYELVASSVPSLRSIMRKYSIPSKQILSHAPTTNRDITNVWPLETNNDLTNMGSPINRDIMNIGSPTNRDIANNAPPNNRHLTNNGPPTNRHQSNIGSPTNRNITNINPPTNAYYDIPGESDIVELPTSHITHYADNNDGVEFTVDDASLFDVVSELDDANELASPVSCSSSVRGRYVLHESTSQSSGSQAGQYDLVTGVGGSDDGVNDGSYIPRGGPLNDLTIGSFKQSGGGSENDLATGSYRQVGSSSDNFTIRSKDGMKIGSYKQAGSIQIGSYNPSNSQFLPSSGSIPISNITSYHSVPDIGSYDLNDGGKYTHHGNGESLPYNDSDSHHIELISSYKIDNDLHVQSNGNDFPQTIAMLSKDRYDDGFYDRIVPTKPTSISQAPTLERGMSQNSLNFLLLSKPDILANTSGPQSAKSSNISYSPKYIDVNSGNNVPIKNSILDDHRTPSDKIGVSRRKHKSTLSLQEMFEPQTLMHKEETVAYNIHKTRPTLGMSISGGSDSPTQKGVQVEEVISGGSAHCMSISGGSDSPTQKGVQVEEVISGGSAHCDARLQAGMEIVSVDNTDLTGLTHSQAVDVIRRAFANKDRHTITFVVKT